MLVLVPSAIPFSSPSLISQLIVDSAVHDVKPIVDFVEKVMLCAMLLTAIYCSSGVRQSYSGVGRSGGAAKLRRTQAAK
jgi:hypothetical protein